MQDFDLIPLDEDYYGMFFGGDSYVIKYTYEKDSRQGYIIYFWQVMSLVHFRLIRIKRIIFFCNVAVKLEFPMTFDYFKKNDKRFCVSNCSEYRKVVLINRKKHFQAPTKPMLNFF